MNKICVLGVEDMVLECPDVKQYFAPAKEALNSGDITYGQIETAHTTRGHVCNSEIRIAPAAPPENLDVLKESGFDVLSFGGNHVFDYGYYGVMDTLQRLWDNGLLTCGAGKNIFEARKPAIITKGGLRFAFLQYNCIGPALTWATPHKAGAAFIRVLTTYESAMAEPGAMPHYCWTFVDPWSLECMKEDIRTYRDQGCVVIVALHIGRMYDKHLQPYEKVITRSAIDVGAEMVLCHHAHEPRSIEIYEHKPIFHGLGNFLTLSGNTESMMPMEQMAYKPYDYQGVFPAGWQWAFDVGKEFETGIERYPFSNLSRNTLIAKAMFDGTGLTEAGFIPCWINDIGAPEPVTREGKGEDILNCFKDLNRTAELDDDIFEWNEDGTEVMLKLG